MRQLYLRKTREVHVKGDKIVIGIDRVVKDIVFIVVQVQDLEMD